MTRKRFFLRFSEALDSIKLSKDEVMTLFGIKFKTVIVGKEKILKPHKICQSYLVVYSFFILIKLKEK